MKGRFRVTPVHSDEELMEAFLDGDPVARAELPKRFGPRLQSIARRTDVRLTRLGLDEDIVQQVYLLLLTRPPGHFDRARGDGVWGYLKAMVRLATRDLLAQYAPPGMRTRARISPEPDNGVNEAAVIAPRQALGGDRPALDFTEDVALSHVTGKMIVDGLEADAPDWLRRVLGLVIEGLTVTEAAAAVGLSRYAVRRALGRWAKPAATSVARGHS